MKKVKMLIGLPRAGKSTLSESFRLSGYTVLSRDTLIEAFGSGENYTQKYNSFTPEELGLFSEYIFGQYENLLAEGHNVCLDGIHLAHHLEISGFN